MGGYGWVRRYIERWKLEFKLVLTGWLLFFFRVAAAFVIAALLAYGVIGLLNGMANALQDAAQKWRD